MTLGTAEFIRRFAMHILPKGFIRIRHYGILSSTRKAICIIQIKAQLPEAIRLKPNIPSPEVYNPRQCPCCKKDTMLTIQHFNHRGPPNDWQDLASRVLQKLN